MPTSLVKTAPHIGRALVAAAALAVASCGGTASDTDSSPTAADEAVDAPASADDAVGTDASSDVAAVRAALVETADDPEFIEALGDDALDCIAADVAADPELTAQVLADDVSDDGAMFSIVANCSPESIASMLTDDPEFAAMTDDEALCLVEAMVDTPELMTALDSDVETIMEELFACAPSMMATALAAETGLEQADAECILSEMDGGGALAAIGIEDVDMSDEELMAAMSDLFDAFATCDISMETLAELGGMDDSAVDEPADGGDDLDAYRTDCGAGDMEACDLLYYMSDLGSEDEAFGSTCGGTVPNGALAGACAVDIDALAAGCADADMVACDLLYAWSPDDEDLMELATTCGGTADGSTPGMCSSVTIALEEFRTDCENGDMEACGSLYFNSPYESDDERFALDSLRAGCADGEMLACDLLYMNSPYQSDDEEFGGSCGGRTDGSTAGSCEESV